MLHRNDIRIRDPFILTDKEHGCYYMYGTTDLTPHSIRAGATFSVYRTKDLEHFDEGRVVLDGHASGFPATEDFWSPEVHILDGRYYLFGSAKGEGLCRATYIFVSDTPEGPFTPVSTTPPTPADWECLDGTLFVEDGTPYMVFCHEWVQIGDGEICAVPLSPDLSHATGEPFTLFRATDHPQVCCVEGRPDGFVTDGPFLFRDGRTLRMIWSSFSDGRYAVLEATADTLRGPWTHHAPRFSFDGGHAMLFEALDGRRMISLHAPNTAGAERAVFLPFPEGGAAPTRRTKNFEEAVPSGYRKMLSFDARKGAFALILTLLSFLLMAATAVPLLWLFFREPRFYTPWSSGLFFLVYLGGSVVYMILHELVHGAVYRGMTGRRLTFGISFTCAYCGVPDIYTYRRCALAAVLAPFLVFTALFVPLVLLTLTGTNVTLYVSFVLLLATHVGGCAGDLLVGALLLFRYRDARTLMNDTGPAMTFYVPEVDGNSMAC